MAKWIIGIVVIAAAGAGLWYSGVIASLTTPPAPAPVATTTQEVAAQPVVPQPENGMAANADSSDTALVQDTTAIDAQIQGLTIDSSNIDISVNDKSAQ